jgi:hypothetical protein
MSGKRKKNKPVRFTDGVPPNEQQRKAKGELTDVCAGKGQNLYQIGDNWFRRGELYDASQQIAALKTVLGPEEYDRRKVRKFTEVGGKVDKEVVAEENQVEKVVGKNEDEDEEDSEEDEDSEEEDSDNEKEEDAAGGDNADEEKKQPGGKGKKRKSPPARKKQAKKDKFLPPPALSQ